MASWMIHLRVADSLLDTLAGIDQTAFVMGNIAPDSGVPNADWSAYFPPKEVSHFKAKQNDISFYDIDRFLAECFSVEKRRTYSRRTWSFFLGYWAHLLTDREWVNRIMRPSLERYPSECTLDRYAFIWKLKKDWYDLDFLYFEQHPDFRAFQIYEQAVGFENDMMDMFSRDAFDDRRKYICSFYRGEHGNLQREYPYLTAEEADKFVNKTVSVISRYFFEYGISGGWKNNLNKETGNRK